MSELKPADWLYPGARWWKMDFHTHTPESTDCKGKKGTPDQITPEKWLLRCMEAGLDCVAVTDHNTGEWIDPLKKAYDQLAATRPQGFRPLYLFPGVELSVNGGFHLLALFDPARTSSDIVKLLSAVEYDGTPGDCDGVTRRSAIEVIERVLSAGGLPIPAHVDQAKKGLLRLREDGSSQAELDARTIEQVLRCEEILAMEVVDPSFSPPEVYRSSGRHWTEVLGSDLHSFQDGRLGSKFTWVKMEQPSLAGLRLALLDGPLFSIRRSDDLEPFDPYHLPEHLLESIQIDEGRYMGRGDTVAEFRFSPWLNALVGGRGTGKSTAVHFMRLGYRRGHELAALSQESEVRRTFERFDHVPKSRDDHGGLQLATEALLTVHRGGVRYRLRWRQDGAGTVVEEETEGGWEPSTSQEITGRFPVRLFSQGQIAALAGESQEPLLGVIDDAAETRRQKEAVEEANRRFYALRARIRELDGKLKARDGLRVELEDVERKLRSFEDAHHADVLRAYQTRSRQEREIQRQLDAADAAAERIESLAGTIAPDDVPERLFDVTRPGDVDAQALVGRLHAAVGEAARSLTDAASRLRSATQQERTALSTSAWRTALTAAKRAYSDLVDRLREQGVTDPSEYGKLVQDRQRLEQESARLVSLASERDHLLGDSEAPRGTVLEARRKLSERRSSFLETSLAENSYVSIELLPYGREPRQFERSLREIVGVPDDRFAEDFQVLAEGLAAAAEERIEWSKLNADRREADDPMELAVDAVKRRFEEACRGDGGFGGHFNNHLERVCASKPELLDRLLTWFPADSLKVEYSRKGDGRDFQPIEQASAGQRSAAMLAFLLAHGDEPLVLDQPEDDLDNHLIYDLVVRQIRSNKLRRQIIVVTHNPNIVVNGDAEMVHALSFAGGQCRIAQRGSLQRSSMRDEVCQIMEGGREAFERRYRRLGQEK